MPPAAGPRRRLPRIVAGMKYLAEPTNTLLRRLVRGGALLCCLSLASTAIAPRQFALAQQPAAPRTVQGKVVDKADVGVKGATVYLKDGHSLSVKSYIASDDGSYRFGQLTQNTDYELWAELNGKKSAVKNLTSFDTRPILNINLKIEDK